MASGKTIMSSVDVAKGEMGSAENVSHPNLHRVAIALGSNMGNRIAYIEQALTLMAKHGMRVLSVSSLYETKAMYYEEQDAFLNGACLIETSLEPLPLLDVLQGIENELGRVRNIDKGPRTLDLDILLFDDKHIVHERLEVPHKLMLEREFVLRPLSDILPDYTFPGSFSSDNGSIKSVNSSLDEIEDITTPMQPITAITSSLPFLTAGDGSRTTMIMAIMNITPDSFSDGGKLSETDIEQIKDVARRHITHGARILDVGGQSTRPGATLLTPEQELTRVLPVIKAIRSMPEADTIAISIDTFYSAVARQATIAGADIINDVSGGLMDFDMLPTAAKLGKPIILMHMRGEPRTMNRFTDYPEGVISGVATELTSRVQAAKAAGVLPWRIILDPGIGFAKTSSQNLELLRHGQILRNMPVFEGIPWLWGVSRKGFIGKITGVQDASERGYGTAAGVVASIAAGADIIRVHDVKEMAGVARMADAIYRHREDIQAVHSKT